MSVITREQTLADRFADLDRRLRAVETAKQLDYSSVKQGSLRVLDAGNIERARVGLQTDGSYGIKLYDPSGNVIFDPLGLVGVMKPIASNTSWSTAAQAFTIAGAFLPGADGTFTLTRAGTVRIDAQANFYTNGGTANYGFLEIWLLDSGSVNIATSPRCVHTNGSGISACSPYIVASLPADTYTVRIRYLLDAGATTTWQLYTGQWNAFQLGG